jgi:hypothetical protein
MVFARLVAADDANVIGRTRVRQMGHFTTRVDDANQIGLGNR